MTNNIKEDVYTKLIERQIYINLGVEEGKKFLEAWDIVMHPLEAAEEFTHFFDHIELETNLGIAWGITMPDPDNSKGVIHNFIRDTRNPMFVRSNMTKISHENGHALMFKKLGTTRCTREYWNPEAPKGVKGPCYVTKVHDQFYGAKKFRTYWVRYGIMWLPVKMLDIFSILH